MEEIFVSLVSLIKCKTLQQIKNHLVERHAKRERNTVVQFPIFLTQFAEKVVTLSLPYKRNCLLRLPFPKIELPFDASNKHVPSLVTLKLNFNNKKREHSLSCRQAFSGQDYFRTAPPQRAQRSRRCLERLETRTEAEGRARGTRRVGRAERIHQGSRVIYVGESIRNKEVRLSWQPLCSVRILSVALTQGPGKSGLVPERVNEPLFRRGERRNCGCVVEKNEPGIKGSTQTDERESEEEGHGRKEKHQ